MCSTLTTLTAIRVASFHQGQVACRTHEDMYIMCMAIRQEVVVRQEVAVMTLALWCLKLHGLLEADLIKVVVLRQLDLHSCLVTSCPHDQL